MGGARGLSIWMGGAKDRTFGWVGLRVEHLDGWG